MLVLGLLLIVAAALLAIGAIFDAGEEATVEILGQTITTTAAGVFVAGAATMLMFLIGVWALMSSMGRSRRKRAERKEAKLRQRDSVSQLEEERTALRAENERLAERLAGRDPAAAGATAGATTAGAAADDPAHHADRTDDATHNDRVIDDRSDPASHETSASGRHRDAI
ncbi:MAG: hypothetical protein ACRDWY_18480 [Actinomycetes bacterium]